MINTLTALILTSQLAYAEEWRITRALLPAELRLASVPGGKERVEIPPRVEYYLCSTESVGKITVTYQRADKQIDYIEFNKISEGDSGSCFVIDPLLPAMDGVFNVTGHYTAVNQYKEAEDITPFPVFTKNGFIGLAPLLDSLYKKPNPLYASIPPILECKTENEDHAILYVGDKNPETIKAYAVRGGDKFPLTVIGTPDPQTAAFYVPNIMTTEEFYFIAVDGNKNESRMRPISTIKACKN